MTDIVAVSRQIRTILNNSLNDPISGSRTGSYVFGANDDIFYGKSMPKVKVVPVGLDEKHTSIGRIPSRQKIVEIDVYYYVPKGYSFTISGSTYKDRELIDYYMDEIEQVLLEQSGSLPSTCFIQGFGKMDDVIWNKEETVMIGMKPVIVEIHKLGSASYGH